MTATKQKRVKTRVKTRADVARPTRAEAEALQPGDIVMLPDGGTASVQKVVGADAYVIEWQKPLGRGPWIFPVTDLVVVS